MSAAGSATGTGRHPRRLPRPAPTPTPPALVPLEALLAAARDLDVEHLPPADYRAAARMLEGLRSIAGWYLKRVRARIAAEFLNDAGL